MKLKKKQPVAGVVKAPVKAEPEPVPVPVVLDPEVVERQPGQVPIATAVGAKKIPVPGQIVGPQFRLDRLWALGGAFFVFEMVNATARRNKEQGYTIFEPVSSIIIAGNRPPGLLEARGHTSYYHSILSIIPYHTRASLLGCLTSSCCCCLL